VPELIIAEEHDQVYQVWLDRGDRDLRVAHIDFHCDMRGFMIDRRRKRAFRKSEHEAGFVDVGNFLGHAIMNGIVTDLRWVHDPLGGRLYDDGGVVGYETDFLAFWHAWQHQRRGDREVPIAFEELSFANWDGPRLGEQLDIDWDALASVEYSPDHTKRLIDAFLAWDFPVIPETTFLVFSPDYSQPDRDLFEAFGEQLATKFDADIVRLGVPSSGIQANSVDPGVLVRAMTAVRQRLRRHLPDRVREMKRSMRARDPVDTVFSNTTRP
jgi:hypothetical protein